MLKTQIPEILSVLRDHATQMEEAPGAESVDLSCEICGVPLENPFLLPSSVVASNYEMCARAFEMGWAGVAYKTVLRIYMAQRGYDRISQMVGAAVENIVDLDDLERDTIVYPRFRRDRCVGCGRCYLSCRDGGHQALRFDEERRQPVLIPQNCVGCHLCLLVCPQNAIGNNRKRMQPKK